MEEGLPELAEAIYREKVMRARNTPASKKMGWGPQLFADACGRMRAGIKAQFPGSSEIEVEHILRKRLERLSRLHEHGIFKKVSDR